jgi:hypothetical protein
LNQKRPGTQEELSSMNQEYPEAEEETMQVAEINAGFN